MALLVTLLVRQIVALTRDSADRYTDILAAACDAQGGGTAWGAVPFCPSHSFIGEENCRAQSKQEGVVADHLS